MTTWLPEDPLARAITVLALAVAAHLLIRALKGGLDRWLGPTGAQQPPGTPGRHPKLATILGLVLSTATFGLWFAAVGLALAAFEVNLTAYFATATVVGLAVGFGSQGLVQDVVIGITLIFSDAMDVGDMVEVSGQVGRVERVGLRFTTLSNFLGQTVFIPNRNIAVVGRYRRGAVRSYVDVQVPDGRDADELADRLLALARGFRAQHPALVLGEPTLEGVREAGDGGWRYVRIRLRLWPGQQALVETALRQRVLASMRQVDEGFADWMVAVTYRV